MTTEHDFKKALRQHEYTTFPPELEAHHNAVLFALRLADKLLKQEVSVAMLKAGQGYFDQQRDHSGFSAMIEQAVKEIENEIQK